MAGPVIATADLGRRFAGVTALAPTTLRVEAGEAVAVLGPNGAGKTTLLRLLGTLLRPTSGRLALFGTAVTGGGSPAVRRRIGVVSHRSFLYPDLTPAENLEFYARAYGVPAASARRWLDALGVRGWAHRPVRTLSRGLEQRCGIARALLHEPDLLLLDEPFAGLDAEGAGLLLAALGAARERGATVLLATHDLEQAATLCGRALILRAGRVTWDGPAAGSPGRPLRQQYEAVVGGAAGGPA